MAILYETQGLIYEVCRMAYIQVSNRFVLLQYPMAFAFLRYKKRREMSLPILYLALEKP